MDVKAALEVLPGSSPYRSVLLRMADDFDLEGLNKLAAELEDAAG